MLLMNSVSPMNRHVDAIVVLAQQYDVHTILQPTIVFVNEAENPLVAPKYVTAGSSITDTLRSTT